VAKTALPQKTQIENISKFTSKRAIVVELELDFRK
jgi:hypothetical protein